ncbi:3-hydroxy-9,10-secoandrosta-1,3,5(10)-triene-9,17-dione monooxygenase oxygenase subunit [Embleya sp. MST-111070]|uniref:3-hydroxy-9,10-secoandrosta-1,3,5(10)-triene-9, 17-dione monooxygenase oxygenase subunit n=1 Tax=Embleya sp. MST-111070 TaxID=3398231 RepID=UPI003F733318
MSARATDVLHQVDEILPVLRERAQQAEDARAVPTDSIELLREAGFFRLMRPTRYGGLEARPIDHFTAVRAIAGACGSTGWVASVLGAHQWHLAQFDARAQEEFWGSDDTAVLSSAYAPLGRAVAVAGGYTLSGRWSFSSGVDHAAGTILGGLVMGADGKPVDYAAFVVPAADYTVDPVWNTVGLRGTGSNDVVVQDVFVPAHRVLSFDAQFRCACPGHEVNRAPMYRIPLYTFMTTTITTPLIGMATGVYEAHVAHQRTRVRAFGGDKAKDDPFAKVRVAEAASDIEASWLQMTHNLEAILACAEAGRPIPLELRARHRRDQVRAGQRAIAAADRLFEASGVTALHADSAIQRLWRDAHAARVHVANDPEPAQKLFGDLEFGESVTGGML